MTYEQAKEVIKDSKFSELLENLIKAKEDFYTLRDQFDESHDRNIISDLINTPPAFRAGSDDIYGEVLVYYAEMLSIIEAEIGARLDMSNMACTDIISNMQIDEVALAHAMSVETEVFNSLAPHKKTEVFETATGEQGYRETDTTAEDRQKAKEAAEKIWQAECCEWSKE